MSPITHAILPVLVMRKRFPQVSGRPDFRAAAAVALAGVLPDVLSPHLTLDERHLSFSHSGAGLLSFLVLVALISRPEAGIFWRRIGGHGCVSLRAAHRV